MHIFIVPLLHFSFLCPFSDDSPPGRFYDLSEVVPSILGLSHMHVDIRLRLIHSPLIEGCFSALKTLEASLHPTTQFRGRQSIVSVLNALSFCNDGRAAVAAVDQAFERLKAAVERQDGQFLFIFPSFRIVPRRLIGTRWHTAGHVDAGVPSVLCAIRLLPRAVLACMLRCSPCSLRLERFEDVVLPSGS